MLFCLFVCLFCFVFVFKQKSTIEFINNTANIAGAAIYASDMSGCRWLGGLPGNHTIFQIDYSEGEGGRGYGFKFRNNTVTKRRSVNADQTLATNPLTITVTSVSGGVV